MTGKLPINVVHLLRENAFEDDRQTLPRGIYEQKTS